MVGFVRCYFEAGRTWLAAAVCAKQLLMLALNFTPGVNLSFPNVTALGCVILRGGTGFSVPVGAPNLWWILAQLGNLLRVMFLADSAATLWQRGDAVDRCRALLVGGGLILCVVYGVTLSFWLFTGHLGLPLLVAPALLAAAVTMSYEVGADAPRAAQLSRDLRDSEGSLELAAQVARLALWWWDMGKDELRMNAIGRALFNIPQDKRRGLAAFLSRIDLEDRERVRNAICETAHKGGCFELEFRISTPGGPTRWVAMRGELARRDRGNAVLRGVSLDISERRRVEREVREQRNELTHLSRVATLGEMAGSLAHEINQPLMAILSNAQAAQRLLARDNPDLAEVRAAVADIVEDDRRAGQVIHRLRALLRKGEVQRDPLDVNSVVADVLRLMRSELMNRGIVANAETAPNLPSVLGDGIQLQQVLLNLVMNGCDAMEGDDASHQLVVRTRLAGGAGVEVSVSDSGRGIPAADLERVFEPFVTTKEHGMGLGLSVCRMIVAAHGGRLWAESVEGKGTTMRFALPVAGESQ